MGLDPPMHLCLVCSLELFPEPVSFRAGLWALGSGLWAVCVGDIHVTPCGPQAGRWKRSCLLGRCDLGTFTGGLTMPLPDTVPP